MAKIFFIFLLTIFLASGSSSPMALSKSDHCDHSSVKKLGHSAGFFNISHSRAARMFYFFFESSAKNKAPVVLWLTGGPGCGSEIGLLLENGPFRLRNMSLVRNNYSWNKVSTSLSWPSGRRYSFRGFRSGVRHNEEGNANDLYDFLQSFFKDRPQYANNGFYITGESYAGHYIPALASRIRRANKEKKGIHINLKGIAIGNGWTNPQVQHKAYAEYALHMKLIHVTDYEMINKNLVPKCENSLKRCVSFGGEGCAEAGRVCDNIFYHIMNIAGVNVFRAGHMVPMDQPKASLQMLAGWIDGNIAKAT